MDTRNRGHRPNSNLQGELRVVYSRRYNIGFFGIERLHPFDSRKYGRAWKRLRQEFGSQIDRRQVLVDRPASDEELRLVHTGEYLQSLRDPHEIAAALEIPLLRLMPAWLLRWCVLRPMRWAVRGSVLAAKAALKHGSAVNLSGGYHHAKPSRGEGFCIFSDIGLIVRQLRQESLLKSEDTIVYVDLDAHQGNGVCHQFQSDRQVVIYDMYNQDNYPASDLVARARIDVNLPLPFGCPGTRYLATLHEKFPAFLDTLPSPRPRLAIYNAGTDVYAGDQLGGLNLSEEDILERDLFVLQQFQQRRIPFVMLLSGGYSRQSYRLVANTVSHLLRRGRLSEPANTDQKSP